VWRFDSSRGFCADRQEQDRTIAAVVHPNLSRVRAETQRVSSPLQRTEQIDARQAEVRQRVHRKPEMRQRGYLHARQFVKITESPSYISRRPAVAACGPV
jgi:hypothetical protein